MQKIVIRVINDSLLFAYQNDDFTADLTKTNIINNSELVFTYHYIKENEKMVSLFIPHFDSSS